MKYKVLVDDNFHYMDESERYEHGEFETYDEAVSACKKIVDMFLEHTLESKDKPIKAGELNFLYMAFGEDPFVVPCEKQILNPHPKGDWFSAWTYAAMRCEELCGC